MPSGLISERPSEGPSFAQHVSKPMRTEVGVWTLEKGPMSAAQAALATTVRADRTRRPRSLTEHNRGFLLASRQLAQRQPPVTFNRRPFHRWALSQKVEILNPIF